MNGPVIKIKVSFYSWVETDVKWETPVKEELAEEQGGGSGSRVGAAGAGGPCSERKRKGQPGSPAGRKEGACRVS